MDFNSFKNGLDSSTESLNSFSGALSGSLGDIEDAGKKSGELSTGFGKLAMAIGRFVQSSANFANQMDQLKLAHEQFERKWAAEFQRFDFQKETTKLSTKKAEIDYNKGFLEINGKARLLEEARLKTAQAGLDYDEARHDIDGKALSLREAELNVERASVGIEQAKLGLAQANINAAKADIDYEKQLLEIQGGLISARKAAADAQKNYVKELEGLYEPWIKTDKAASDYTKTVGGSKETMEALKKETMDFANSANLQGKYNTSIEELLILQTKYNNEIGRSIKLTDEQKESMSAMRSVYGDEKTLEFATKLTNFGLDVTRASGIAGKLFSDASKHGVSVEKFSKNMLDNIKLAQTLTFDKGVKGLQSMAEKATELNFNMQETAKAADKLSTLEGAMEASAQLSVLGGNFAQFSNPLAMMNEALNDADALQDRIINQFSGLASWDSKRGEITMSGQDRLRMKTAAQAMGMDPTEISNMVFTKARKDKLAPEINSLGVDDDIKRLLSNVAQLDERGNGYVTINGKQTSLQEAASMNPEELSKILRSQNNSDSENISDIAQAVLSIKDHTEGLNKAFGDSLTASIENSEIGQDFMALITEMAKNKEMLGIMTDEQRDAYKESADFNKTKAEFDYNYAKTTNAWQIELAGISREQTKLGVQTAEQALRSAEYGKIHADYAKDKAPLKVTQLQIQQKLSEFAADEARIALSQLDLGKQQAIFREKVELPLQEENLKASYKQAKRLDDIFWINQGMLQLQYVSTIADAIEKAADIPFFGGITKAIAGKVSAGIEFAGALSAVGGLVTSLRGIWDFGKTAFGFGDPTDIDFDNDTYKENKKKYGFAGSYAKGGEINVDNGKSDIGDKVSMYGHVGEYVMPLPYSNIYRSELESMRKGTFPVGNGSFNSMTVNNSGSNYYGGVSNGGSFANNNLKLEISGTITLNCSGETSSIDAKTLLNNEIDFIQPLVGLITKSQIKGDSLGNDAEMMAFKSMYT